MQLLSIVWDVSPDLISLGPVSVRWYGLMFAIGFLVGYVIVARMFKHEGAPEKWLGTLLIYLIVATVVGARLGHVFFYEWDHYKDHLSEIPKVWEGGLASHGGAIACMLAVCLFSWFTARKPISWTMDKVVIPIALTGGLIRLGNLMNSEIYGTVTDLPWGFIFVRDGQTVAMHPTQIYEALAYLILFGLLMWMYWKRNAEERPYLITGVFFFWVFTARFLIEFVKNPQEEWEASMTLNMGQLLSLPFIAFGLFCIIYAMVRPRQKFAFPDRFADADDSGKKSRKGK